MAEPAPDAFGRPVSDDSYRLLVQSVQDYAIFLLDPHGRVSSWNIGAERIKRYRAEDIIGRHFSVFYPDDVRRSGKPEYELKMATAEGRFEDEGWRIRADGTRFWAVVVITALFDESGELRGFGKVTRDMTERMRAESELVERRQLFFHLVEAQEAERRRIAWDVHDDSIQAMAAVYMRLQLLGAQVPPELGEQVAALEKAASSTIDRLRDLVRRLRPLTLDGRRLGEALRAHLEQVIGGAGLAWTLDDAELDGEPPPEVAVTVFRIAGEALTNVVKHAGATTVRVRIGTSEGGTLTEVADDGVGTASLPETVGEGGGHYGLLAMRERAEAVGGWWTLAGEGGQGTIVRFWLPPGVPIWNEGSEPR